MAEGTYDKLSKRGFLSKRILNKLKGMQKRSPGGSIKEDVRELTATLPGDKFPIFNRRSALAALKLRGHADNEKQRLAIIARAAQFAPKEARAARSEDN